MREVDYGDRKPLLKFISKEIKMTKYIDRYYLNGELYGIKFAEGGYVPSTITGSTIVWSFQPTEYTDLQWCYISPDWKKMYVNFWNNFSWKLVQYSMATPRDINNATYIQEINLNKPDGIYFSNDWTYMFTATESSPISILRYTLSTPRDITTATQDQSKTVNRRPFNISFSNDWKHMYYAIDGSHNIYHTELSIPYDLTSETSTTSESSYIDWGDYPWIAVKNDWKYIYRCGTWYNWTIKQFELAIPYDISSNTTEIGSLTWLSIIIEQRCLFVSNDCKYVLYCGNETIVLYQTVLTN